MFGFSVLRPRQLGGSCRGTTGIERSKPKSVSAGGYVASKRAVEQAHLPHISGHLAVRVGKWRTKRLFFFIPASIAWKRETWQEATKFAFQVFYVWFLFVS